MKYRWWVFGCLLWCVVGMVPIAYASETQISEQPVLGSYELDTRGVRDCSPTLDSNQQQAVHGAASLLRTVVASPAFRDCVEARVHEQPYTPCRGLIGDPYRRRSRAVQAAHIVESARSTNDVEVQCVTFSNDNVRGRANVFLKRQGNYRRETFRLARSYVGAMADYVLQASVPEADVGLNDFHANVSDMIATMVHESMHQQGYLHNGSKYNNGFCKKGFRKFRSAPEIVEYCVEHILSLSYDVCPNFCLAGGDRSCFSRGVFELIDSYVDQKKGSSFDYDYNSKNNLEKQIQYYRSRGGTCRNHVDPAHRSLMTLGVVRNTRTQISQLAAIDTAPDRSQMHRLFSLDYRSRRPSSAVPSLDGHGADLLVAAAGDETTLLRYFEPRSPRKPEGGLGVEAILRRGDVLRNVVPQGPSFVWPASPRLEGMRLVNGSVANRSGDLILSTDTHLVALSGFLQLSNSAPLEPKVLAMVNYREPLLYTGRVKYNTVTRFATDTSGINTYRFAGRPRIIAQVSHSSSLNPLLIAQDDNGLILLQMVQSDQHPGRTFVVQDVLYSDWFEQPCHGSSMVALKRAGAEVAPIELIGSVHSKRFGRSSVWLRARLRTWGGSNSVLGTTDERGLIHVSVVDAPGAEDGTTVGRLIFSGYAGVHDGVQLQNAQILDRLLSKMRVRHFQGFASGTFLGAFFVDAITHDRKQGVVALFQKGDDIWTYRLPGDPLTHQVGFNDATCGTPDRLELNTIVGRTAGMNGDIAPQVMRNVQPRYIALQMNARMANSMYGKTVVVVALDSFRASSVPPQMPTSRPRGDVYMFEPVRRYYPMSNAGGVADYRQFGPTMLSGRTAPTRCSSTGKACHNGVMDGWVPGLIAGPVLRIRRRSGTDAATIWNHATGAAIRNVHVNGETQ